MILHEYHDDLDAFLDGCHELGAHHQIRAVADHDEDIAIVVAIHLGRVENRHFDAKATGNLIPHAGKPVFDVITLAVTCPPQLVQVTGH